MYIAEHDSVRVLANERKDMRTSETKSKSKGSATYSFV